MTAEETAQVQAYISNLQAQQTATLRTMEIQHGVKLQNEQRARKIAQKDSADMVKAMHEIFLCNFAGTLFVLQNCTKR